MWLEYGFQIISKQFSFSIIMMKPLSIILKRKGLLEIGHLRLQVVFYNEYVLFASAER